MVKARAIHVQGAENESQRVGRPMSKVRMLDLQGAAIATLKIRRWTLHLAFSEAIRSEGGTERVGECNHKGSAPDRQGCGLGGTGSEGRPQRCRRPNPKGWAPNLWVSMPDLKGRRLAPQGLVHRPKTFGRWH